MTTSTFASTHPVDLRAEWRGRRAAKLFSLAPGVKSVGVVKSVVTWSWRPSAAKDDHTRASKVQVHRECGRLFVQVSDPSPTTKHVRIESRRKPLESWEQLEALVAALLEGEPMVPRVDRVDRIDRIDTPALPDHVAKLVAVAS